MTDAKDALARLRTGNQRFVSPDTTESVISRSHVPGMETGQDPFAIVLSCSDSRVPVELIFDQGPGDLFVIRVAGNIVAPSQIGSIEYAATQLGTRLVVVLGHSNCGAVGATVAELAKQTKLRSPNLRAIVDRIRPAVEALVERCEDGDVSAIVEDAMRANVQHSVNRLQHGSLALERLIESGELTVVGAEYAIEDGRVRFFD